jgi:hypothetical protein
MITTKLHRALEVLVPRALREIQGPWLSNSEFFASKRAALVDEETRELWEQLAAIYEASGYDDRPHFVPFAIPIEQYFALCEKCRAAGKTPEGDRLRRELAKVQYGGLSFADARKKYLKSRMDAANEGYE